MKKVTFSLSKSDLLLFLMTTGFVASQIASTVPLPKGKSNCVWGNVQVCGDDYETYPNLCALQNAGVNFKHYGSCVESINANGEVVTTCEAVFQEICGADGVTYGNRCRLDARKVAFAYNGPCRPATRTWTKPADAPCDCPLDFSPVCTMTGTTYESNCVLLCNQQIALTMEPCPTQCQCPRTYEPVCGADSKTYDNSCLLDCVKQMLIGNGECANIVSSCENCSSVLMPVYTTDGVNYDNYCKLVCNKGKFGGFGKSTNGKAVVDAQIKTKCNQCSRLYLPICGNDGKTYDNECLCTCTGTCEKYSNGVCPKENPQADSIVRFPECQGQNKLEVCGVDNRTYDNICYLNKSNVMLQYPGPCRTRGEYNNLLPQNPALFALNDFPKKGQNINFDGDRSRKDWNSSKNRSRSDKNKGKTNKLDDALEWMKKFFVGSAK